jgi:hypothetical protein
MNFQPESFAPATDVATPQDVRDVLRGLAKSARKGRMLLEAYPQRTELMAILADARLRIDRINATAA